MTNPARMMRAMRASSRDPASLTCENLPVPDPGAGELLVQVRATVITADEHLAAIPCHDLSGVMAVTGGRGHRLAALRRGLWSCRI